MTATPVLGTVRGSLAEELARRSPGVAAALDPEQARARAEAWAAGAVPGAAVATVRVGSVLYRPDGRCRLRYRVRLAPSGREQVLLVDVPPRGSGADVRAFPDDPALPTLPSALDPVLMREVLGRVVPGTGGERAIGRCSVDVVHHPRRGRCVLRYRLSPGAGGPGELRHPEVYGKVHADSTASAAASALRLLRRELPIRGTGVRVPRPLAVVPSLRLGLTEAIAGRPVLPERLGAACRTAGHQVPPDPLTAAVRAAAEVAAAVHACSPAGTPLPVRDLAGERAAADTALGLLDGVWPAEAARLRRGLTRALDAAARHGDLTAADGAWSTPGLAHGDFTPGQVLLDDAGGAGPVDDAGGAGLVDDAGGAGLVDVDTLCVAEPALDLGRFLAYLQVAGARRSRASRPLLAELSELFLDAYLDAYLDACPPPVGTRAPDARRRLRARTAAYRALGLARLGASACWQLKDDRLDAAVDLLDSGHDLMRSGTP